ncbi:MAG: type II toxin-antitoxin system HicB family antitoxin [Candidatus Binataceae bacterium]
MTARYAVVIEHGERNLSAYVPDLPGCIATGRTQEELIEHIREAIQLHLEGLREEGLPIPAASSECDYVEVEAAPDPEPENQSSPTT